MTLFYFNEISWLISITFRLFWQDNQKRSICEQKFYILFSIHLDFNFILLLERTLEYFITFFFTLFVSVDRKISLLRVQTSFTTTHRNGIGQPDYTTEYAKLVGRIILFVSECHGQMHKTSLTYISITSRYEPNDVNWVRCVMTNNLFRYYIKHLNREHWDVLNHRQ